MRGAPEAVGQAQRVRAGASEHAQQAEPQLRMLAAEARALQPVEVEVDAQRVRRHAHHVQAVKPALHRDAFARL